MTEAFSRALLTTLARSDINAVAEIDVRTAVVNALVEIENHLEFGRLLESRGYTEDLRGCRKVYVDRPDWQGKPRFRRVYWCSPDERQPRTARILAFGPASIVSGIQDRCRSLQRRSRNRRAVASGEPKR
ncbi:unannotated protein [freshwater metagenome]|uniref:Unannotated protein n=1 Tax=freshwater metagenome TaxID=449393 RepID=A0A6J7IFJ8_9ZZZZ